MTVALTTSTEPPRVTPPKIDESGLQECVRDLVALSTMPSAWIGKSPVSIAESVRDLMVSMMHPDSVYVQLQDRPQGKKHVASAHGRTITPEDKPSGAVYRDVSSEPLLLDSEVALGLAAIPIGPDGELGQVAIGSSRPHFPTRLETLLMQVAANQIAVALRHSELTSRHEKVEQELELAREAAERSNRVKSDFLAMMSHELRTPLNAIAGYVEIILGGIRGPITPEQRTDLARIKRSQQHLLRVIENVLGYLKLGSGRVVYQIRDVSVDDVVTSVEDITKSLVESKGLMYHRRGPDVQLLARADQDKVEQIVLNLLSNAIKFTPPGGDIQIDSNSQESRIRIRVSDSGIGIPADRLDSVFEPFVQLEGPRTRSNGGTGLGLSISRDFAHGMGGQLLVESEVGRGSVFTLLLPKSGGVQR